MKDDTLDFSRFFCAKFFSFSERNCDPFLIQTSILPQPNVVAGGGIRSLKQRKMESKKKGDQNKILIPLNNETILKSKACQEMIMYERTDDRVFTPDQLASNSQVMKERFGSLLEQN